MRKILLLLFVVPFLHSEAQQIQMTLKPGASPNSARVVIRCNAPLTGIISTVQVTFKVPKTGLTSRPPSGIQTNFFASRIAWTPSTLDPDSPSFVGETLTDYYYTYNGDIAPGAPAFNFPVDTDIDLLEVAFIGNNIPVIDFRAVQRPDGGLLAINGGEFTILELEGMCNFFISVGGIDRTNFADQFYNGTNSTSDDSGNGYSGEGFVQLLGGIILPVEFASFNARCNDKGALLTWATASEHNSDRFEVQKSVDGTNWTTIDEVAAAGASAVQRNYQYVDLAGGASFYRIREVDVDGRSVYTAIKTANCNAGTFDVSLFPIPAKDKLTVIINSTFAIKTDLQILDMTGKTVRKIPTQVNKGNNNYPLNINDLPGGQYMLTSSDPAIQINKKFTISR